METNPANLRAAVRLLSAPTDRSSDIGFRCARDAAQ
jgi:formylglycine-generating enzyme required for sulfatase activity